MQHLNPDIFKSLEWKDIYLKVNADYNKYAQMETTISMAVW